MTRSRTTHLVGAMVVSSLGVLACGDNDPMGGECVGHTCVEAPINLPEGGEVRLEIAYLKDAEAEIRTAVWFADDQSPESRPWPRDPVNWYLENAAGDGDTLCVDMRGNNIWPSGEPDSRNYIDVGDAVTLSGGGQEFVFNRQSDVEDNAYRNVADIGYTTQISPFDVELGIDYTVEIPGSDALPATTYDNPGLYLPPDYEMMFPNMDDTINIPLGEDFPVLWEPPENVDEFQFAFVSFNDQIDPLAFCIGPNSGQMVIPQDVIETLPPGGNMLHGVFSHRVEAIGQNRRIDLLGVNCRFGDYVIQSGGI